MVFEMNPRSACVACLESHNPELKAGKLAFHARSKPSKLHLQLLLCQLGLPRASDPSGDNVAISHSPLLAYRRLDLSSLVYVLIPDSCIHKEWQRPSERPRRSGRLSGRKD